MYDKAIKRIQDIIEESEAKSHWIPMGGIGPFPELAKAKSEREEISMTFSGCIFISHSSFDSVFIERFIISAIREASGDHFFMLNMSKYSAMGNSQFQHALWISA